MKLIVVQVAGELRKTLGNETINNRKVRKITTRSMANRSENKTIETSPEFLPEQICEISLNPECVNSNVIHSVDNCDEGLRLRS